MEGQKSTAAQCSFAFVEWYLGELYQQWKRGKETIVRPKNCYYTIFLFSWFVVGVFFCLFLFLVLKRCSLSIQVIPGLVFSPPCRPLINQTWLLTVAQLPPQEPRIWGPCLGRDLKQDGPMQEPQSPCCHCRWVGCSGNKSGRLCSLHSGIQCGVKDRTNQSFHPAWQEREKNKIKEEKGFWSEKDDIGYTSLFQLCRMIQWGQQPAASQPVLFPLLCSCQHIKLFPLPSVLSRCRLVQNAIWYCIWSITFTAIYSN